MKIFANKLMQGDEVRVIAPSLSLKLVSQGGLLSTSAKLSLSGVVAQNRRNFRFALFLVMVNAI